MKVTPITPRGFCHGVVSAWALAQKVAAQNKGAKKIYMIGRLVHNDHILEEMRRLGIVLLDDDERSRMEIVQSIKDEAAIVIFSAHGTDHKAIAAARDSRLEVYDTTCKEVAMTHDLISSRLQKGMQVIFIGKHKHPETLGVMALDPRIVMVEKPEDVEALTIPDKAIFVTNQTTLSIYDVYDVVKAIKRKFTDFEFANELCSATTQRQNAVIDMDKTIDVLLIVGDARSSNSNRLVDIAKTTGTPAYLVDSFSHIKHEWLVDKKNVGVTAGASTPTYVTTEVIKYLGSL